MTYRVALAMKYDIQCVCTCRRIGGKDKKYNCKYWWLALGQLLEFDVLETSEVMSEQVRTCDSAQYIFQCCPTGTPGHQH